MGFADLFKKDYAELALNEARNGNYMKAAEHFKTAFNKTNNSEYIINAATLYEACNENGLLLECLRIGSSKGDANCLIWLGNIYRDGQIVKADRTLAENYYRLATEVGSSFAYYMWGQMYYVHCKNHPTQFHTAMGLFEEGFVRGSSECANIIGEMYYYGHGVEVDIQKALEYYRLSIQDHNATGYYNLGRHYYFGLGVKRDDNVAYNYFIEAEKRGCHYAAEFLSKDRTKLRSHLEMEAKYFGKVIGNAAVDSITNTLTEGIADGIAECII